MRQLVLAATVLCSLSGPALARWFVGHSKGEICVPLDDIALNGTRLYYGGGPFQKPDDYIHVLRLGGFDIRRDRDAQFNGQAEMYASFMNGKAVGGFAFFNNVDLCRKLMESIPQ